MHEIPSLPSYHLIKHSQFSLGVQSQLGISRLQPKVSNSVSHWVVKGLHLAFILRPSSPNLMLISADFLGAKSFIPLSLHQRVDYDLKADTAALIKAAAAKRLVFLPFHYGRPCSWFSSIL